MNSTFGNCLTRTELLETKVKDRVLHWTTFTELSVIAPQSPIIAQLPKSYGLLRTVIASKH